MQEEVTQKTIALVIKTAKLDSVYNTSWFLKRLYQNKNRKNRYGWLHTYAEWESRLTEIAKGQADPDEFMAGIEAMTRELVKTYSCISEDKQKLFQAERVAIGTCPRCGEAVYEGRKNYYCGNRACQFVMWKNDRFFEERRKVFTPKIAAALLKDGKAKVKGLYSMKTGKTYDGTVLLADTGGKYVNYRVEHRS